MTKIDYSQMSDSEKLNHILFVLTDDEEGLQKQVRKIDKTLFRNNGTICHATQLMIMRWSILGLAIMVFGAKYYPKIAMILGW